MSTAAREFGAIINTKYRFVQLPHFGGSQLPRVHYNYYFSSFLRIFIASPAAPIPLDNYAINNCN